MRKFNFLKSAVLGGASVLALATAAYADDFNIPSGDLSSALSRFSDANRRRADRIGGCDQGRAHARRGGRTWRPMSRCRAFWRARASWRSAILPARSPWCTNRHSRVRPPSRHCAWRTPLQQAAAASSVETVVVTSSKIKGDIQTVPIAITALSQEQLTSRQIAGGPDLVKEVPNLTFSKTNFSGYTIQIRGIGTQAISVTTDPAVAVALNDIPFIRNHFFEQEFFDVNQVEVLRGPQGTLYGRNATAGVVNVISAKPTDQFEAMLSADWGNYPNRRYEGMVNIPIVDDRLDLRVAGEWTKRDGYTINELTGKSCRWPRSVVHAASRSASKPVENVQATLVWEHFQESDDRMRTAKQLCKTDPGLSSVLGVLCLCRAQAMLAVSLTDPILTALQSQAAISARVACRLRFMRENSFGVPNGFALPYVVAGWVSGSMAVRQSLCRYRAIGQSARHPNADRSTLYRQERHGGIQRRLQCHARAHLHVADGLQQDFLWSTEDYNRFDTAPDIFIQQGNVNGLADGFRKSTLVNPDGNYRCTEGTISIGGSQDCAIPANARATGSFCDPQLGCSTRLVAQDISRERAWQFSQEFRLASNFKGPFNFSVGGNYMHYETVEDYFVFANSLTMFAATSGIEGTPAQWLADGQSAAWMPGVTDNHQCF